jgi:choline-sulfatase
MRILYLDLDTTRADHLGCYGYHRNTSPTIDQIASEGVTFANCYVTDAPCLPSRSALISGRFGIHNGVVGHGGSAADPFIVGRERGFAASPDRMYWAMCMNRAGLYTVTVSPFAERHGAWHFYSGYREMYNPGKRGGERAEEVNAMAIPWLQRHAQEDNWFLHINYWDPHTAYRTPESFGNPFEDDPPPDWLTEEIRQAHYGSYGPHSAQDTMGWSSGSRWPRMPDNIASMDDFKKWIDGYDVGIRYADHHIEQVLSVLDEKKVLDDTVIMVSADHGENQGELNIYGDHHTADNITSRVPMIIRWPGVTKSARVDNALHYQFDIAATILEMIGARIPPLWDGRSFADAFKEGREEGRESLVISQMAWSCQRSVRFRECLMMRTYHDGFKDFPPIMLFDLDNDPHLLNDLTEEKPEVVNEALAALEQWHADMMATSTEPVDPMQTVLSEGGPFHVRTALQSYCERLRATGRAHHAESLMARHGR